MNPDVNVSKDSSAAGDTSSARRLSVSGSRRNTIFGKSLGAAEVEDIIGRVLSERGVVMSLITLKELVEKFGRHEQNIA